MMNYTEDQIKDMLKAAFEAGSNSVDYYTSAQISARTNHTTFEEFYEEFEKTTHYHKEMVGREVRIIQGEHTGKRGVVSRVEMKYNDFPQYYIILIDVTGRITIPSFKVREIKEGEE